MSSQHRLAGKNPRRTNFKYIEKPGARVKERIAAASVGGL
jgi:hypothetical protein